MFLNKSDNGLNNICGAQIARFRKQMNKSQRALAEDLQRLGLDVEKRDSTDRSRKTVRNGH